tara:strand:- start:462 stop:659 length:198 start_codon:yes stop_codon:yes gene_type:complete
MAIKRRKSKSKAKGRGRASKAKARAAAPKRSKRPAKSRVGKTLSKRGTKVARKSSAKSAVRGRKY